MIRGSRQSGFSLLEALVGLTIIGVAVLLTMALVAQQPAMEKRLAARQEVLRLMEMEMETLRSTGALPRIEGGRGPDGDALDLGGLPRVSPPAARDLRMWLKVSDPPLARRLYQVEVMARYEVEGHSHEVALRSMLFNKLKSEMLKP